MTLPISGGIGIATTKDGGSPQPAGYFAELLRSSTESAWADARPRLEKQLKDLLGQGDLIHEGFTLYDITLNISPDLSYSIDRTAPGDLMITVTTGGNYVEATSTQPTAAGSWADPRVSVSFGLTFSYVLDIPPVTGAVSATGFSNARVLDPVADSHNLIADIGFFLNDVISFFGGPNLIQSVESVVASMNFAPLINNALAPLNAELDSLAAQGFWFLDVVVDQLDGTSGTLHGLSIPGAPADRLDVLLIARALDRSGIVEGEIRWPKDLGRPMQPGLFSDTIDVTRSTAAVLVSAVRTDATAKLAASPIAERPADAPVMMPAAVSSTPAPTLDSPLDAALTQLAAPERAQAVDDLRQGVASRFISLVGDSAARLALAEFANGRSDFTVQATTPVGGVGLFPDMKAVSHLAGLWAADDETTYRRRFRLADVATGVPLTIAAAVANGLEWHGSTDQVTVVQAGWRGTVTVIQGQPPRHATLPDQVSAKMRRRTLEGGIAFGHQEEVELNPQPLPPVEVQSQASAAVISATRANPRVFDSTTVDATNRISNAGRAGGLISDHIDVKEQFGHRIDVSDLVVENPTGTGVVTGIDFTVQAFVAPVIH